MKQTTNKVTNRDILKFLHNAQLYAADPVSANRIDVLSAWGCAITEEVAKWVEEEEDFEVHPDDHELVFVLVSVAHELQDRLMRKENRRCRPRDSESMKSMLESCLR